MGERDRERERERLQSKFGGWWRNKTFNVSNTQDISTGANTSASASGALRFCYWVEINKMIKIKSRDPLLFEGKKVVWQKNNRYFVVGHPQGRNDAGPHHSPVVGSPNKGQWGRAHTSSRASLPPESPPRVGPDAGAGSTTGAVGGGGGSGGNHAELDQHLPPHGWGGAGMIEVQCSRHTNAVSLNAAGTNKWRQLHTK